MMALQNCLRTRGSSEMMKGNDDNDDDDSCTVDHQIMSIKSYLENEKASFKEKFS